MTKKYQEWNIDTPWGKLAMVSWGCSSSPPVLMVHGYMDSAATFNLLADHLIDGYYYVAFDLPGHGKSDPLPPPPLVNQGHIVEVIRRVVDHMKWQNFTYMGHFMAVFIGCLYHAVYPGRIARMICLDPLPAFNLHYQVNHQPDFWYMRYNIYYERNFGKSAADNPKLYKYDDIVRTVANNRTISESQAEVVLSRSLVQISDELYRLSWEPRVKTMTSLPLSEDTVSHLLFKNTPPMLMLRSTIDDSYENVKIFTTKLLDEYHRLNNCRVVNVTGHHDVHITSPQIIAAHINDYLKMECTKSKL